MYNKEFMSIMFKKSSYKLIFKNKDTTVENWQNSLKRK